MAAQVQGRLERVVAKLTSRTAAVARQAARVAAGQRPRGHHVQADVQAHAVRLRACEEMGVEPGRLRE